MVESLEELAPSSELLADHTGNGDHREAAVVELLGLHLRKPLGVLRLLTHTHVDTRAVFGRMVGSKSV